MTEYCVNGWFVEQDRKSILVHEKTPGKNIVSFYSPRKLIKETIKTFGWKTEECPLASKSAFIRELLHKVGYIQGI